jgi:Domain of unknown function (DUF4279)
MINKTQINVELSIFGDNFITDSLSDSLLIKPTATWIKGYEIKGRKNVFRKETSWRFETGFIETLFLDGVLKNLIDIFENKVEIIKNFIKNNDLRVKVFIVIEIYDEEKPAIYFDSNFLNFINGLGAEIDVDMYFC